MRLINKLTDKKDKNIALAIESYHGFIQYVIGEVKKNGLKEVLNSEKGDELYALKKNYERFLTFAEESQWKLIPLKHEGSGENGEIKIQIEVVDENKIASDTTNRISRYIEV